MAADEPPQRSGQSLTSQEHAAEDQIAEAFRRLHGDEYVRVIAHLQVHGATLPDAKDAAQDAFKHAWQLMHQPQRWAQIENPALWIRGVARNMWRTPPGPRRQPTVAIEHAAELPDPNADPGDLAALHTSVMDALKGLHPDVRNVMLLKIQKFSLGEIVARMNAEGHSIDEVKVRNLLCKGRAALRPLRDEIVGRREGARSR